MYVEVANEGAASDLVTAVHHHALQTGLDAERNPDFLHIDRILLSLVFHCSRETHERAMRDIGATLKSECSECPDYLDVTVLFPDSA